MKPRVYVETSIVSYLTALPARDIVIAGRQQSTRDWWVTAPRRFELVVSDLVLQEAAGGDPAAARARLDALASAPELTDGAREGSPAPVSKPGPSGRTLDGPPPAMDNSRR